MYSRLLAVFFKCGPSQVHVCVHAGPSSNVIYDGDDPRDANPRELGAAENISSFVSEHHYSSWLNGGFCQPDAAVRPNKNAFPSATFRHFS